MSKSCNECGVGYGYHRTGCPGETDSSIEEAIMQVDGEQFMMGQKCDVLVPGRGPSRPVANERGAGRKDDSGKAQWNLLKFGCIRALRGVVGILEFGAKKYKAHSWREVENGLERYHDAKDRHWEAIYEHGWDARDAETGKLHIDHINCNGLFLAELIRKQYNIKD